MAITLKAARVNAGLTQMQAAKALGVSKDVLSNIERGKTIPKIDLVQKMEVVYGISYNDLIFLPENYG